MTKNGCGIEGVPTQGADPTFELLVAGLARASPKTAAKFLRGEPVGRSESERQGLESTLTLATREAVALRRAENPIDREDEAFGKAFGKAAARVKVEVSR